MLCEIEQWGNFWSTWLALTLIGFTFIMLMSGIVFYFYYQIPTFDTWKMKSNPNYPSVLMVKKEIIQMTKGMLSATLCPSLSLFLAQRKYSKAFCGWAPADAEVGGDYLLYPSFGFVDHLVRFLLMWIVVDFWEFYYHRIGHTTNRGWNQHKHHHHFFNPSPFAVIADEYIDQFVRALPLLLFPLLFRVNMDIMFFQFAIFFYGYGVYLHWGHEISYIDAHHPYINSAFQHYLHHAISIKEKPYHTGFFWKIWDNLFDSCYKGECFCVKCETKAGKRTFEQFQQMIKAKPDYSELLNIKFWLTTTVDKVQ